MNSFPAGSILNGTFKYDLLFGRGFFSDVDEIQLIYCIQAIQNRCWLYTTLDNQNGFIKQYSNLDFRQTRTKKCNFNENRCLVPMKMGN